MYMYVREKMKAYVCMLKECACMYHVHVHVMLSTKLVRNEVHYHTIPQFLKDFFTTAVGPFTHGLNRGVMLHLNKIKIHMPNI